MAGLHILEGLIGCRSCVRFVSQCDGLFPPKLTWTNDSFQIDEFRSYLETSDSDIHKDSRNGSSVSTFASNSASLLRGTNPPLSHEEILSKVPPQELTDKLATRFLHTHRSTWRKSHLDISASKIFIDMTIQILCTSRHFGSK